MKQFDSWNDFKKVVNSNSSNFHVREREIRYVHLWINIGFEEDGKGDEFRRPVVVLKKVGNMFAVLPMTTKGKDSFFYYTLSDQYFSKISRIILSQWRALDKSRFIDKR